MATITLTVPDAQLPRVIAAVTANAGYSPTLPDGSPNPQTPAEFVKQLLANYLKHFVLEHEAAQAKATNDIDVS